jgi:hypothetical protein
MAGYGRRQRRRRTHRFTVTASIHSRDRRSDLSSRFSLPKKFRTREAADPAMTIPRNGR